MHAEGTVDDRDFLYYGSRAVFLLLVGTAAWGLWALTPWFPWK